MTDVQKWSTTAAKNNQAPPDGSPELMKRSDVNNAVREVMRAIRKVYAAGEFITSYDTDGDSWTPSRDSPFTIRLAPDNAQVTDITSRFPVGSRVKIVTDTPSTQFGFVSNPSFSNPNTFIEVDLDDGSSIDTGSNLLFTIGSVRDLLEKTAYYPTGTTLAQLPPEVPTIDDLGNQVTRDGGHDPEGDGSPGINADKVDGMHASEIISQAEGSASRNVVYNGEFMIWQRGTPIDSSTSQGRTNVNDNGNYCADRWMLLSGNSTSSINNLFVATRETTSPPSGFWSNLKLEAQGTPTAQDLGGILQILDGKDTAQFVGSEAVSISVWLKASTGIGNARIRVLGWSGTEDSPTSDPINDWGTAGGSIVLETSWTVMIDSGTIAPTTSWIEFKVEDQDISSFGTLKNLAILISVDDASFVGGDTLEVAGVQIENATTSTTFGHRDYGVELGRCERYYTNTFDAGEDPRNDTGSDSAMQWMSISRNTSTDDNFAARYEYPMHMRATPTVTIYNPGVDTNDSFWDQRTEVAILESVFAKTVTERFTHWSLDNNSSN